MDQPPTPFTTSARDLAIALTLGALAFVLRTVDLDLLEFKGDEAQAVHLALPMAEGRELPQIGMMSSVGLNNPPLFIWFSAIPVALSADPRVVTAVLIGGLNALAVGLTYWLFFRRFGRVAAGTAALLFATGVWPVLYGRKLWAQCCLPPFTVLLLWALVRMWEVPRTWVVAAVPLLVCVLWQLHFSGIPMAVVVVALLAVKARTVRWSAFVAGFAAAVVLTLPYLDFQRKHEWPDVSGLIRMAKGQRADGEPKAASTRTFGDAFSLTGYISASASVDYALGPTTPSVPDFASWRSSANRWAAHTSTGLLAGLLVAGAGLLGWLAFAPGTREDPRRGASRVVLGFTGIYLLLMSVLGIESIYPHYFIILYPAPFLAAGLVAGRLWDWNRSGRWIAGAALCLVVAGQLGALGSFRGYLRDRGGTAGDYGVLYEHKAALIDWAVANGLGVEAAPGWEFGHMIGVRKAYDDMGDLSARVNTPAPNATARRVRIIDTLRQPGAKQSTCVGRQDFGPLIACPR